MLDPIRDAGIRHVDEIAHGQRAMVEKALYMRAQSYMAHVKARLLTATIFEVEGQRKELARVNLTLESSLDALHRKQQELAAEVARRMAIFDNSSAGVMVVDGERRIVDANACLLEMSGYSHAELVGSPSVLLHRDGESYDSFCERVITQGDRPGHFIEYPVRRRDGSLIWCDISGHLIDAKDPKQGMVCVCVDISARRRAEQELKEREERLNSLIESLPDAIWFKDAENRWQEVNEPGLTLFGMLDKPWRGYNELEFAQLYPEQREAHLACLESDEQAWAGKGVSHSKEVIPGEDERDERHFDVIKVPLFHSDGSRKALVVVGRDVTEQWRSEQALIRARDEADSANRAKSAFLANMSHELRTPLNAMLGYAQILGRDPRLESDQRQAVETIRRSGDYLLTLINDVLDLAKVEAGRFELVLGPCELPALLHNQVEIFRYRAEEKGLGFRTVLGTLPAVVEADEKRVRQILMNLLGNAIKFTVQGHVQLGAEYADGELTVRVSDSGIGIPPERIDTLFQPFQQEGDSAYKAQGTGLGLAISRSLVEQMGGRVLVESRPGQGSTFSAVIPLLTLTQAEHVEVQDEGAEPVVGYRRRDSGSSEPFSLLLVDDAAENLAVLRGMLDPLGFALREAHDGEQAIREVTREHPDLVLMDLVMPGINGLEATRRLHALPGTADLPVVVVSASAFADDREQSRKAGAIRHIPKPVQLEELIEVLGACLPLEWLHREVLDTEIGASGDDEARLVQQRDELLRLVRRGAIRDIQARLEALGAARSPSTRLYSLWEAAGRFDLKRLRKLLEQED